MNCKALHPVRSPIDLLSALPEELLLAATCFLDPKSLLRMRQVKKSFYYVCQKDDAGWSILCQEDWKHRIFISPTARSELAVSAMAAYRIAQEDAKMRQHILMQEFCYDPTTQQGTIWSFRFKESAGPDWTSWDPWYNGNTARSMVFLEDGSVKQYVPQGVDHRNDLFSPNLNSSSPLANGANIMEPPVSMTWRFSQRPMDLPERPTGSYLRFSVGGRDVPTYVVRRSPTGNWGFIAESCWGLYTSFPMPPRKARRLRRVNADAWVQQDEEAVNPLTDDSSFIITNEIQWREALLYNFGATSLPEGDTASADFDRMFGQTFHNNHAQQQAANGGMQVAPGGGDQQQQQQAVNQQRDGQQQPGNQQQQQQANQQHQRDDQQQQHQQQNDQGGGI